MTKVLKKDYKILAVIPARGGSKGVARKNIKPLAGRPLLCHMLSAALESKVLDYVVISSEDKEILAVAETCGRDSDKLILVKRPKALAKDSSPTLPVVQHALKKIEKDKKLIFDYIVLLQVTSPFVSANDINRAVAKIIKTKADSVVSVYRVSGGMHPIKMKRIENDRLYQYVKGMKETVFRRQDLDPIYKRNGGIYVSKRDIVMGGGFHGFFMGEITRPYLMSPERSIDIDTEIDFELAELMMKKLRNE